MCVQQFVSTWFWRSKMKNDIDPVFVTFWADFEKVSYKFYLLLPQMSAIFNVWYWIAHTLNNLEFVVSTFFTPNHFVIRSKTLLPFNSIINLNDWCGSRNFWITAIKVSQSCFSLWIGIARNQVISLLVKLILRIWRSNFLILMRSYARDICFLLSFTTNWEANSWKSFLVI